MKYRITFERRFVPIIGGILPHVLIHDTLNSEHWSLIDITNKDDYLVIKLAIDMEEVYTQVIERDE